MPTKNKPTPKKDTAPLRLVYLDPSELQANPRNWRQHPAAQTTALADTIAEVGWAGALLYNERTKRLIDGHARRELFAGKGKVPVLIGSWSEQQEATILATLDPLAAMATANKTALEALLKDVQTSSSSVQAMLDALAKDAGLAAKPVVEDEVPDPPKVATSKPGQLWLLGEHRLLCGDSTKAEDVARVMGGEKAGLCFTSPPYAQQRDYGEKAKEKVQDWDGLMRGVFGNLPMEDAGQVLVNLGLVHRDGEWLPYWDGWIEWMRAQGWRRFGWYVWDKLAGMPGDWNGRLAPSHEFVFHFNRESVHPEKTIRKKPESIAPGHGSGGVRDREGNLAPPTSPEKGMQPNKIPDSVIRLPAARTTGKPEAGHAAVFPVGLPTLGLQAWTGLAYEPFMGSGTTLIAAQQLSRRCYGIEIEPRYIDVIIERWEKLTGGKARLG